MTRTQAVTRLALVFIGTFAAVCVLDRFTRR